jgi:hypothetical protein
MSLEVRGDLALQIGIDSKLSCKNLLPGCPINDRYVGLDGSGFEMA